MGNIKLNMPLFAKMSKVEFTKWADQNPRMKKNIDKLWEDVEKYQASLKPKGKVKDESK